jgi:hypothetical protein
MEWCDDRNCPAKPLCKHHLGRSALYAFFGKAVIRRRVRLRSEICCPEYKIEKPKPLRAAIYARMCGQRL